MMARSQQPSNSDERKPSAWSILSCGGRAARLAILAPLIAISGVSMSCLGATTRDDIEIFSADNVSPALLARSANKLIALGEDGALQLILLPEGLLDEEERPDSKVRDRGAWMLRLLYGAKKGKTIRSPAFGALMLPHMSMPRNEWPRYPLAISKNTIFVLAEGYTVAGHPQSLEDYAAYCQRNGVFNTKPYVVPTKKEAQAGLDRLLASKRWKSIEWTFASPSRNYSISQQRVQRFLQAQVDANDKMTASQ